MTTRPTGLGALAQRIIMLDAKLKAAKSEVENAKAELESAKETLRGEFAAQGVDSIKYHGYTVYAHTSIYAGLNKDGDPDEYDDPARPAMDALKAHGAGHLVKETVNQNSLTSWVREFDADLNGLPILPEGLAAHIRLSQKDDIRIRKA